MAEHQASVDIEHQALRGSAVRAVWYAVLTAGLQLPMLVAVATEESDAAYATDTLRLALLLQVGFALALVIGSFRTWEYLQARERRLVDRELEKRRADEPAIRDEAESRRRRIRLGVRLVAAAGVLALVEVPTLLAPVDLGDTGWRRVGTPGLAEAQLALLAVGVAVLLVLRYGAVPSHRSWPHHHVDPGDSRSKAVVQPLPADRTNRAARDRPGRVITCSGGGIRSASFCLGALQALTRAGVYRSSDAVIGVSGGGYMAAAFHYTGRGLGPDQPAPFTQGSSELALLRRRTRYLLPNPVELFRGVLSVLWGVLVNLVFIVAVLRLTSWVLGWYLARHDVLVQRDHTLEVAPPTWWWFVALGPWVVAAVTFVVHDKLVERFVTVTDTVRRRARFAIGLGLRIGMATAVLMLGVPYALDGLNRLAGRDQTLPAAIGGLTGSDPWGLGTLAATVASLITLGRSVWKGLETAGDQEKRLERLVVRFRTVAAPWVGSVIIVGLAFVLLVRWTEGYATSAAWQSDTRTPLLLGALVLAVWVLTAANRTSLHHFYRERLASAYLVPRERDEGTTGTVTESPTYRHVLRVSQYAAPNGGDGPELVMAAAANVTDPAYVPTGRGCVPFVIAADRTGVAGDRSLPAEGTQPTPGYEQFADFDLRDLTVPAAMAISGAAFSPLVGRASARTRPVRVLLTVLNARLGVWLPNPYLRPSDLVTRARNERRDWEERERQEHPEREELPPRPWRIRRRYLVARVVSVAGKPGPYRLLREAFGQPSLHDRKLYVTDGGHYDNLGLLEALRRQPHEIVVIDASNDRKNSFGALADAIATARMDLGTEVTVDVRELRSTGEKRAAKAWAEGRAVHADGTTTRIYFLKAQLVDGMSNDVEHYASSNPDFPRRSTGKQLYDEWDFEAYRELGEGLTRKMLEDVRPALGQPPRPRRPADEAQPVP